MDPVEAYAVAAVGCIAAQGVASRLSARSLQRRWPRLDRFWCRHFLYPRLIHRHGWIGPWTRAEVVVLTIYLIGTATAVAYGWPAREELRRRLGGLAMVNAVPLYFGTTHDLPATILGLSLPQYGRAHRTVSGVFVSLGAVHSWLAWRQVEKLQGPAGWTWNLLVGKWLATRRMLLTGALEIVAALLSILFMALLPLRTRAYEPFLRGHQGLGLACLVGLWRHAGPRLDPPHFQVPQIAVLVATIALGLPVPWDLCRLVWRNRIVARVLARMLDRKWPSAVGTVYGQGDSMMGITVSSVARFDLGLGQYVHLVGLRTSALSIFQSHPFMAFRAAEDGDVGLLVEKRASFTANLFRHPTLASPSSTEIQPAVDRHIPVLLYGPYGRRISLGGFDHLLVVAEGPSRIVSILPYLLNLAHSHQGRVHTMSIVWQLRDAGKLHLVRLRLVRVPIIPAGQIEHCRRVLDDLRIKVRGHHSLVSRRTQPHGVRRDWTLLT
ncbi:uncharacterized protein A1O9_13008 [Exophiala aquamarina CBS 119918]|uniref:FAD-binding 8 domain-containing protein n=1 Tax=Exophiala aquamarina CBS 119918 TaxID=1182545 RepID=A0A072NTH4_9EURO|nr:uncharacterized protein A1O9_13008 [Exophiala aquamarina CBS 119918]KEF50946.1 hypothetical protein A1O9_13008 [Exophiala aquamarina CBS 119918]